MSVFRQEQKCKGPGFARHHLLTQSAHRSSETFDLYLWLKVGSMATTINTRSSRLSSKAEEGGKEGLGMPLLVHSLNHGFTRPLGEKELVKSGFKKAKTGEGFGYRSGLRLGGTGTLA